MMRFAMSGAHQVGKTTIIDAVRDQFEILGGVMRAVAAGGYGVAAETTPETIEAYMAKQLESEAGAARGRDVLSDRVLLDGLAYVEAAKEFGFASYPWWDAEIMLLRTAARAHAASFDVHCFIPIEFPSNSDLPFHAGGEDFRAAVSDRLAAHLDDAWPIPVVRVSGSVEERVATLRSILNRSRKLL